MSSLLYSLGRNLKRHTLKTAVCCVFTLPLMAASTAVHAWWWSDKKPPETVQNLFYGEVLYSFYQQDYFQALVDLSIADIKGGIEGHGSRPELLVGGLSLSYGMDKKAEAIFEKLLDESVDPAVRDQAWFYLGKMYYRRKLDAKALETLNKVQGDLPESLRDEYYAIKALLLGKQGQFAAAKELVEEIETRPWINYADYNLAMAYVATGDINTAQTYIELAKTLPDKSVDAEFEALLDRVYLAEGYLHLRLEQPALASESFKQIRLSSPWAQHALLGYGWSSFDSENYGMAVQAWQSLQNQPVVGPIMHEAFVAESQIYEKLQAKAQALQSFERAARRYETELQKLEQFIQGVAMTDPGNFWPCDIEKTWASQVRKLEGEETPQSPYLIHMAAQHNFQTVLQDWCDVSKLQRNLEVWKHNASSFKYMLETRHAAREKEIAKIAQWKKQDRLPEMIKKRNALAHVIENADKEQQGMLLLTQEQLELRDILASAKASYEKIKNSDPDAEEYAEKLRRVEGALQWQASEQLSTQLRGAKKALLELDEEIDKNQRSGHNLDTLVAEPVEINSLQARVNDMQQRIDTKLAKVTDVRNAAQTRLRNLVIKELRSEQENIRGYLAQARLAIARIYDELYQAGGGQ